jgi:hypothetical protein
MSLIPLAAHHLRLAARDNESAQDFFDAVVAAGQMRSLVFADVEEQELHELDSTEWQWYAGWRQEHGGDLSRIVIDYLTATAVTRYARFELDALVLRDVPTNDYAAAGADADEIPYGAIWLTDQARGAQADRATELMDDALQCATDASWFLLRQLMSLSESGESIRVRLGEFAEHRQINPGLRQRWGLGNR